MRFRSGQLVLLKNYTGEIEFCFPDYLDGRNASVSASEKVLAKNGSAFKYISILIDINT